MRVALINPGRTYYGKSSSVSNIDVGLPLGIMYLAAVLEKKGHEVKIIDSLIMDEAVLEVVDSSRRRYGAPLSAIKSEVRQFKPDVIGVSNLFSSQIIDAVETVHALKEACRDTPIVIGGLHVTVKGIEFMKENPEVDFGWIEDEKI